MIVSSEVEVEINAEKGVEFEFLFPGLYIEISVDCFDCKKICRTLELRYGDDFAKCIKGNHLIPAKITEIKTSKNKVRYFIEFEYIEFKEKNYDNIISESRIKSARVHYKTICPNCNRKINDSTQINLVRPRAFHCRCGQLLYTEENDTPVVKNNRLHRISR